MHRRKAFWIKSVVLLCRFRACSSDYTTLPSISTHQLGCDSWRQVSGEGRGVLKDNTHGGVADGAIYDDAPDVDPPILSSL